MIDTIFVIRDFIILCILPQFFINNKLTINNLILLVSIFLLQYFPLFEILESLKILRFNKYDIIFQNVYKERMFIIISFLKEIIIGVFTIMLVFVWNNADYRIIVMFIMFFNFILLLIYSKIFVFIYKDILYINTYFDVTKPILKEDVLKLNIDNEQKDRILKKIENYYKKTIYILCK